jgi:hypothetical protein
VPLLVEVDLDDEKDEEEEEDDDEEDDLPALLWLFLVGPTPDDAPDILPPLLACTGISTNNTAISVERENPTIRLDTLITRRTAEDPSRLISSSRVGFVSDNFMVGCTRFRS